MNKSFFTKFKGYIGLFLIVIAIAFIFYWESFGRETLLYKEIVVLNKDVEPNTLITEDLLITVRREENTLISNVITSPQTIIGLESKHYIPKNTQLDKRYFDEPEMVLNEGEFIFKLPREWIKAFPSSLRRKDKAYFFAIDSNRYIGSIEGKDVVTYQELSEEIKEILKSDKPLIETRIAYVKDNANREVITVGKEERLNGSSQISDIEIIANLEQIKILEKAYNEGYEFIILYR